MGRLRAFVLPLHQNLAHICIVVGTHVSYLLILLDRHVMLMSICSDSKRMCRITQYLLKEVRRRKSHLLNKH